MVSNNWYPLLKPIISYCLDCHMWYLLWCILCYIAALDIVMTFSFSTLMLIRKIISLGICHLNELKMMQTTAFGDIWLLNPTRSSWLHGTFRSSETFSTKHALKSFIAHVILSRLTVDCCKWKWLLGIDFKLNEKRLRECFLTFAHSIYSTQHFIYWCLSSTQCFMLCLYFVFLVFLEATCNGCQEFLFCRNFLCTAAMYIIEWTKRKDS
jgi:hypothetical protein